MFTEAARNCSQSSSPRGVRVKMWMLSVMMVVSVNSKVAYLFNCESGQTRALWLKAIGEARIRLTSAKEARALPGGAFLLPLPRIGARVEECRSLLALGRGGPRSRLPPRPPPRLLHQDLATLTSLSTLPLTCSSRLKHYFSLPCRAGVFLFDSKPCAMQRFASLQSSAFFLLPFWS